jgi:hypothetical protein
MIRRFIGSLAFLAAVLGPCGFRLGWRDVVGSSK